MSNFKLIHDDLVNAGIVGCGYSHQTQLFIKCRDSNKRRFFINANSLEIGRHYV